MVCVCVGQCGYIVWCIQQGIKNTSTNIYTVAVISNAYAIAKASNVSVQKNRMEGTTTITGKVGTAMVLLPAPATQLKCCTVFQTGPSPFIYL